MRNQKKFLALLTAATMIVTPVSAFADSSKSGSGSGSGSLEGWIVKDTFDVTVPTIPDGTKPFTFILDPQGLIDATTNAAYAGKTFESGASVYFSNTAADATNDYSSTSDEYTIVNVGTVGVNVALKATVTDLSAVKMTADDTFASDTSTSLYLALIGQGKSDASPKTVAVSATTSTATIAATMTGAPDGAYETVYDSGVYDYVLTDAAKASDYTGFDTYSFKLKGACNTAADWTNAKTAEPNVEVVWDITSAASASDDYVMIADYTKGTLSYTFVNEPTGTMTALTVDGTSRTTAIGTNATYSAGVLTFNSNAVKNWNLTSATTIKATIGGVDYDLTLTANEYNFTVNGDGTITYFFVTSIPTGTLTAVESTVGGTTTSRTGTIGLAITYANGSLTFTSAAVANWAGAADQIKATIGGTVYTFTVGQ